MKWTQYDLAAHTGLSTKQITRLELGESFPTSYTLDLLSKAFSVPVTSFFIDPEDPFATIDIAPFYELNKHLSEFYVTIMKEVSDELTLRMQGLLQESKFNRFEFEKLIAHDSVKDFMSGIDKASTDNLAEKIAQQLVKKLVLYTNRKLDERDEESKERKMRKKLVAQETISERN